MSRSRGHMTSVQRHLGGLVLTTAPVQQLFNSRLTQVTGSAGSAAGGNEEEEDQKKRKKKKKKKKTAARKCCTEAVVSNSAALQPPQGRGVDRCSFSVNTMNYLKAVKPNTAALLAGLPNTDRAICRGESAFPTALCRHVCDSTPVREELGQGAGQVGHGVRASYRDRQGIKPAAEGERAHVLEASFCGVLVKTHNCRRLRSSPRTSETFARHINQSCTAFSSSQL
ncbi:unnamed protein product [Pleuronectes platessa]|uniref:Uncharacterized protein n=1 Tax=Pleuronectes platessa TaxID=8262 RepID=A0A9N7U4F5_PLEPL|nr:unnamed protein product [Pleuronectes platessa]